MSKARRITLLRFQLTPYQGSCYPYSQISILSMIRTGSVSFFPTKPLKSQQSLELIKLDCIYIIHSFSLFKG